MYAQARPLYPEGLFDFLAGAAPGRSLAWDCGTGNGQAARALAKRFDRVVGSDASAKQLRQAEPVRNILYVQAESERLPGRTGSVDLLTVAQALHWFDLEQFYPEARRLLAAGGLLAAWAYGLPRGEPAFNRVLEAYYEGVLGAYWLPGRRFIDDRYETLPFPFEEVEAPEFEMATNWTLENVYAYLASWSAGAKYRNEHGRDPLELVRAQFQRAWGSTLEKKEIHWPVYLKVGQRRL